MTNHRTTISLTFSVRTITSKTSMLIESLAKKSIQNNSAYKKFYLEKYISVNKITVG